MFTDYLLKTRSLFTRPSEFYADVLRRGEFREAARYSMITGGCVALELALKELFSSGSAPIVALVAGLLLLLLPCALLLGVYAWSAFMRLCATLLNESLPVAPLRVVVAYSMAGFLAMLFGFSLGKWISLVLLVFQVYGVEKMLKCSRWTSVVFVMFPFSIMSVLLVLFTLMFKVF